MSRAAPIVLALVALVPLACASGGDRHARPAPQVGRQLLLELPDLGGTPVDLARSAAGKVVVVDFWATWCEPCRESMPAYDAIYQRLRAQGLEVVGVSVDSDFDKIPEFLERTNVSFPILWDESAAQAIERFQLQRVPITLIADRKGRIRHVHEGFTGGDMAETVEQQVQELLAESP